MINRYFLRSCRKDQGLTQSQLAERVGISRTNYLAIENLQVHNINFLTAMKICYVLHISPYSLYSFLSLEKK